MSIHEFGLDLIKEISNKYEILVDDKLLHKYPLLKFRLQNIFTYLNNISDELENISKDYNNNNQEYITNNLHEMIQLEQIINNYITNLHH
jgi:hypothetical protein